jgi:hypothetical protein
MRLRRLRVSLWVEFRNGSAAGLISPEATIGAGQRAKINAELASAQVREQFDVEQRFRLDRPSTNHDEEREEPLKVHRPLKVELRGEPRLLRRKAARGTALTGCFAFIVGIRLVGPHSGTR